MQRRANAGASLFAVIVLGMTSACHEADPGGKRMYVDSGAPPPDSCRTVSCHRDATCNDTDGGPSCVCNAGFSGDGFSCADIDECATDADDCDPNATCTNTVGSFMCTCNAPAWQGGGQVCTDANECADGTDDCSANATCINTVGSFTCDCVLSGDGGPSDSDAGSDPGDAGVGTMDGGAQNLQCRDIDECATGTHDCDPNATCVNNNDGFTCQCKAGYAPTGNSDGHGINGCTFQYCDLTGRWAVKTTLVVSWNNVRFDDLETGAIVMCGGTQVPSHSWELREFVYNGSTLQVRAKGCGSTATPGHNRDAQKFGQYIPFEMFDRLDLGTGDPVPLPSSGAQPGMPFVTPYEAITFGMRLPNPSDAEQWVTPSTLPPSRLCSTHEPPCWEDDDKDPVGAPGYTTWSLSPRSTPENFYILPSAQVLDINTPIGTLGACYTLGSRSISRFNGTYQSCDRITGAVDVLIKSNGQPALDAWVQGCKIVPTDATPFDCYDPVSWNAMESCRTTDVSTLNRQVLRRTIDSTNFEMVRVPNDTECPDVRAMFPVADVVRNYCECGGESVVGCP